MSGIWDRLYAHPHVRRVDDVVIDRVALDGFDRQTGRCAHCRKVLFVIDIIRGDDEP